MAMFLGIYSTIKEISEAVEVGPGQPAQGIRLRAQAEARRS